MSERCSAMVYNPSMWRSISCSRRGTIKEGGKWYCKQHLPSAAKARSDARDKKNEKKWKGQQKKFYAIAKFPRAIDLLREVPGIVATLIEKETDSPYSKVTLPTFKEKVEQLITDYEKECQ